jgi:hypothetical protein
MKHPSLGAAYLTPPGLETLKKFEASRPTPDKLPDWIKYTSGPEKWGDAWGGSVNAKRLGVCQPFGALERGSHPDAAASRQSAANCDGDSNGGFLPKAATLNPHSEFRVGNCSPRLVARSLVKTEIR